MIRIEAQREAFIGVKCCECQDRAIARMTIGNGLNEFVFWLCVDHLNQLRSEAADAWGAL